VIPTFAVVGHPNKGKSSIVATLAEDERVAISATPGTTREANAHTLVVDGESLYVLVDTPGFQRARDVLDWLKHRSPSASERPAAVAAFVAEHESDPRYHDECELLRPIVSGAGILYVVDGTKPYGPEYELEMQILQWTGQPRLALINLIGEDDFCDQWRKALDQYFSIVRVFDAMNADFATRIGLLKAFAELDQSWRAPLERAVDLLTAERGRRRERAAAEIAGLLHDALTFVEREKLPANADTDPVRADVQERLVARLQQRIARREQRSRKAVEAIYHWVALPREEAQEQLLATDLFADEGWELFGLSDTRLLVSGIVSGAVAGGGIDALLGGASMLLGAGIGALVGGAGVWFGGHELAKVSVLGETLGGRVMQVGPVRAPNFPWVLLGRAWVHHHLVSERNHARREALSLNLAAESHVMDTLPDELRRRLARHFKNVADDADSRIQRQLTDDLVDLLAMAPGA
jgi:hypothetical protein